MLEESYGLETLRTAPADVQRQIMEDWFRQRFEDPAENMPYESASGGYQWIWGGPHDAREELEQEFQGTVPDAVLDELVTFLQRQCFEWAPTEPPGDYDHGLFEAVSQNSLARQTLGDALGEIHSLLQASVADNLRATHVRLLYANAVTALETFLSDTFINRVFSNETLLQGYIDSEPRFKERKILYKDVLREATRVTDEAKKELLQVVWHNLAKVKPMYADVLGIDLGDVALLAAAIRVRHDIVHRNGRRQDGSVVDTKSEDVVGLIRQIEALADRVELPENVAPVLFISEGDYPL